MNMNMPASRFAPCARTRACIIALAAFMLAFARPALAETFYGYLQADDMGYLLEDSAGDVYLLDGDGLDEFLDMEVVIEGEMFLDDGGEPVIRVFDIRENNDIHLPEDNVVFLNPNYHGQ